MFVSVVQCGGFKKIVSPTTTVHFCLRLYDLLPALAPKGLAAAGDGVLFYRQTVNEECLESVSAWLEVEFDQVFLLHNLSEFLALVLNG